MKRIIAIPLLVIYLFAVSGVMINLHYCGGKYYSFNLQEKKTCCCKGESAAKDHSQNNIAKKDCCSNKYLSVKIAQDQWNNGSNPTVDFVYAPAALLPSAYTGLAFTNIIVADQFLASQRTNAPPGLWQNIPLYTLNSSRVLYS